MAYTTQLTELYTDLASATITAGGTAALPAGSADTLTASSWSEFAAVNSADGTCVYISDPAAPSELMQVTNISGATGSVIRGACGTTPVAHAAPYTVRQSLGPLSLAGLMPVIQATGDTTGATDTAAAVARYNFFEQNSIGGTIRLGPGAFYFETGQLTVLENNGTIFLQGDGAGSTIIYAIGSGDTIRMYNPTSPPGGFTGLSVYGGGVKDLTIDGSMASSGAVGLHIGDGEHYQVTGVQIQHFNGTTGGPESTGSVGLWIDNSVWWTEKGNWDVIYEDCQNAVLQTTESGNNSNAENDFKWTFFLKANQNCITMKGIAHYLGKLEVRGVCNGGVTNTGVFLTADASSAINNCQLDIAINSGSSGTFHQTANCASGFSFQSNRGRLLFNGGPWQAGSWGGAGSSWAGNQTACSFAGDALGDTAISLAAFATGNGPPQPAEILAGNPLLYAAGFMRASDGKINDFMGDFFPASGPLVLTGNITIGLGGGTKGSVPGPQRKTLLFQQAASGGPYTVSWPYSASPNATGSPSVIWPGGVPGSSAGTAPVMPTAANAIMLISLVTWDGATWYGTQDLPVPAGSGVVTSVTAGDGSIVVGGSGTAPTLETGTLDQIANLHAAAANWSNNSKKITGLANGSAAQDAAAFGQIPVADSTASDIQALGSSAAAGSNGKWADSGHVHPNTGLVTGVTAADTSVVVGGTSAAPTVRTGTLDVVATQHPPAASVPMNSQKFTGLANGSAPTDSAAFGQIPLVDSTAADILADGTQAAGSNGKWADSGHVHPFGYPWLPSDDGFLGANSDPAYASGGNVLTAGTLYLMRLVARAATTITNLWLCVSTVGSGTSTGTYVGLLSASGSLLSGSSDVASSFTGSTGWKPLALTTPQPVTAGTVVYAVVLCNLGTTQVSLTRQFNSANSAPQATTNVATLRWAQKASYGTSLSGGVTMSGLAATVITPIVLWN